MLTTATLWRIGCRSRDAMAPLPFFGQVLRSALGAAIRHRACDRDCGGDCEKGAGCGYFDHFRPGDNKARYRIDSSDVEGRELPARADWSFRLLTFADPKVLLTGVEDALFRGLGPTRATHRVVEVEPLQHGGDDAPVGALNVSARGAELVGSVYTRFASPTHLQRGHQFVPEPTLDDVLRGCFLRAGAIGWRGDGPAPGAGYTVECRAHRWHRWQAAPGKEHPLEGVVGTWRAVVDARQAELLAIAEAAGVGKHVTMGLGTVRVDPVGRHAAPMVSGGGL